MEGRSPLSPNVISVKLTWGEEEGGQKGGEIAIEGGGESIPTLSISEQSVEKKAQKGGRRANKQRIRLRHTKTLTGGGGDHADPMPSPLKSKGRIPERGKDPPSIHSASRVGSSTQEAEVAQTTNLEKKSKVKSKNSPGGEEGGGFPPEGGEAQDEREVVKRREIVK